MDLALRLGAFDIGGLQPINSNLYNVIPASPARMRSPTRHHIATFTSSNPPAVHTTEFIYKWMHRRWIRAAYVMIIAGGEDRSFLPRGSNGSLR